MGQVPEKPIVLAPRGEFSTGALMMKRLKKRLYILWVKHIGLVDDIFWQASSDYEKLDILTAFGHHSKNNPLLIHVASNLPPKLNSRPKLIHRPVKQVNSANMVFLSRIARKKNLDFALNLLTNVGGDVLLDIYGPMEDQRYWQECQVLIDRLPSNVKVEYRGLVSHDQVEEVFSRYHLFLFPTRGENFGHVILEALSAGCLVLTSDQTPWRDLTKKKVGWDVSLNEPERFYPALKELIFMDNSTFQQWSKSAQEYAYRFAGDPILIEANRRLFLQALQG
jgi:glycosyltransferase involved in cell wall biosynthesis